jgi:hypothetical protein
MTAIQLDLLAYKPKKPRRIGSTFSEANDGPRLERQYDRVLRVILDGKKRTLRELANESGAPEASASARFREIRANGYPCRDQDEGGGRWVYWLELGGAR